MLLGGGEAFPGVLGPLAELITVADGATEAIAAALGASASADIAVSAMSSRRRTFYRKLRDQKRAEAELR